MLSLSIIAGTRPNFVKLAPLVSALSLCGDIKYDIIHTGQHYDDNLSKIFFKDLKIPEPSINLNISHSDPIIQISEMIKGLNSVLSDIKPDVVLVIGDVNSTLAGSIVARNMGIKLGHIESGERCFNKNEPEEINRIVADHLSDILFCTSYSSADNLRKENIPDKNIKIVGDLVIDNIINNLDIINMVECDKKNHIIVTLHRQSNVDNIDTLSSILKAIYIISKWYKVIFPMHPRTEKQVTKFNLWSLLENVNVIKPMGYIDMMSLLKLAKCVITDSGGIQTESWFFKIPCITIMNSTSHIDSIEYGINRLSGTNTDNIIDVFNNIDYNKAVDDYPLWHGYAAYNIVKELVNEWL